MKKIVSVLLSSVMAASLAACGSSAPAETPAATAAPSEAPAETKAPETEAPAASEEGKVLNVAVWNDEFASRFAKYYPGFEMTDPENALAGGKIGDVQVNFLQTENQGSKYQDALDGYFLDGANEKAEADKKIDLFCIEADYALKYVDADANVAMPLKDLGIDPAKDLADQYAYTQDIVKDANGDMRASSWQAASAGLIYNREIAKEVLGTDDPAEVQEYVKDWATYNETAKKMAEKGYLMTASYADTYRVYSNNVSAPWVDADGNVTVDPNIKQWVDDTKAQVEAKETSASADLWSDDWSKGFYGGVFCYFGPAWLINFSMHADDDTSVAAKGGWGLAEGPQGFYWGGTWICAAVGTDNPELDKDVILKLTADKDIMKQISINELDCTNNKTALSELASSEDGNNPVLGGQNPYAQLAAGAEKVDMSNTSIYDQACNENFQTAMKNYFAGNATYDEALDQFASAIKEAHPELTLKK